MQINPKFRTSFDIRAKLPLTNVTLSPIQSILQNLHDQLKKLQNDLNASEDELRSSEIDDTEPIKDMLVSPTPSAFKFHLTDKDSIQFYSKYKQYKSRTIRAIRQRKIFILLTPNPSIRKALVERGWVEKCAPNNLRQIQALPLNRVLKQAEPGNDYEIVTMSKLLHPYPPRFVWQAKYPRYENKSFAYSTRNRIYRSAALDFTTKIGLIGCIELSHWSTVPGVSEVRAPRHHRLQTKEDQMEFQNDYRTTYCISLLLFTIQQPPENVFSDCGTLPLETLKFAFDRLCSEINRKVHYDLDLPENDGHELYQPTNEDWKRFFLDCDLIQSGTMRFYTPNTSDAQRYIDESKTWISQTSKYWPTLETDGYNNIWILKPANWCRGNGILIRKSYIEIMECVRKNPRRKYVVQKYLERPLLIYNTKFDIRQYFLMVILDDSVCAWMYRNCYLKFSSQEYDLRDLKESIHVTNNAVQKKYRNAEVRNPKLPAHNMWSLSQFEEYLGESEIGSTLWTKRIYPAMKRNIIGIVSASLDETELTPNSFELYGCDFILDRNCEPSLLEINATPDMSPSTKVTAKLCPQVLEDVIRVVIDHQERPDASTGGFELIFKTQIPRVPQPISSSVVGTTKPITQVAEVAVQQKSNLIKESKTTRDQKKALNSPKMTNPIRITNSTKTKSISLGSNRARSGENGLVENFKRPKKAAPRRKVSKTDTSMKFRTIQTTIFHHRATKPESNDNQWLDIVMSERLPPVDKNFKKKSNLKRV